MEVDEFKLAKDTGRALQAEQIVNNELIKEAFDNLESEYIRHWRSTKYDDQLGREKLFLAVNVIGQVKKHLQTIIANGKLAGAQLESLAKARSR